MYREPQAFRKNFKSALRSQRLANRLVQDALVEIIRIDRYGIRQLVQLREFVGAKLEVDDTEIIFQLREFVRA